MFKMSDLIWLKAHLRNDYALLDVVDHISDQIYDVRHSEGNDLSHYGGTISIDGVQQTVGWQYRGGKVDPLIIMDDIDRSGFEIKWVDEND
jgi:hypothetical protein